MDFFIDISFYSYGRKNYNSENPVIKFVLDVEIIFGKVIYILLTSSILKITQVTTFSQVIEIEIIQVFNFFQVFNDFQVDN